VTLAEARQRAAEYRPLDQKKALREAAASNQTFGQCANALILAKRREWRSEVHAGQWRSTIDRYCAPILDMPVGEIGVVEVLRCLQPIWNRIPETATRLRGRIELVLDFAKASKLRSGENSASWRGNLAMILPKRQKLSRSHHPALPYQDVPAFLAKIRDRGVAGAALEFCILTATRSGEVLGAQWSEIDLGSRVWTIPAARTKTGVAHRVPLSIQALGILGSMASIQQSDRIFPVGDHAMRKLCPKGVTVHGARSSFRDWVSEETFFARELAEAALAHVTGKVEAAYRRGDALEKRRELMTAWANYCVESRA
jgi:integrase